jgi:hypothetical protein
MNASRWRIRSIKPTDGLGPWRDVTSARHGQRGCSCAHGSHVCGLDGGCWADRYASRRSPDTSRCSNHEPYREPRGPPGQTDLPRLRPCVHLRQPPLANHTVVSCPQGGSNRVIPAYRP